MKFDVVKLDNLLEVLTDYHANGAYQKLKDNVELLDKPDYAVMIRTTNFEQNNFETPLKFITEYAYDFLVKSKVFAGDIIMNKIANAGSSYLMPELDKPVSLAMNLFLLRINTEKANPVYVYIYLKIHEAYVKNFANGSVTKTITKEAVRNLEIKLPKRNVQDEIVEIYFSLSNKIELNRQTNQTLEQIAQAIFKSWFVDFEPIKAKIQAKRTFTPTLSQKERKLIVERAAMCAISGKSLEELEQLCPETQQQLKTTAALFPDALVESELGEIPEGWEVKPFLQMIELIGGGTPKRSETSFWDGNIAWFSVKDTPKDGDVFVIETVEKITELGLNKSSTKVLPEGVTIISARGTVGKLALVGIPTAMNQSCYGVKGVGKIGSYLNYFNLKQVVEALKQNTHGAVFDTITKETFNTVALVDTTDEIKQAFEVLVFPLFKMIKNNLFESQNLSKLRDTLLPKLLSGELTLSSAAINEKIEKEAIGLSNA